MFPEKSKIICIDNSNGTIELTIGKVYNCYACFTLDDELFVAANKDDLERESGWKASRFILATELMKALT